MASPPTSQDIVMLAMMTRGEVVIPDNERQYNYELTKGHNVMLHGTNKPCMFLICHDEGDVLEGLKFAKKHGITISIRSGAHGVIGDSCKDGSLVIDLSRMNAVEFNSDTQELVYGPGAVLSDLTVTALRHGRMVTVGIAPPTGAGGLTLHGGLGWLTQKYGMAVDNITSTRFVTADGSVRTVGMHSETAEDKEIFFAMRGAAGSLGIVTQIKIRTYPMEMITGGMWAMADDTKYTATRALVKKAQVLVEKQEKEGKRTFTGGIYFGMFPPLPEIPKDKHGKPCSLMFCGAFGADEATQALMDEFVDRPILFGAPPSPMPFGAFNQILAGMFLNFPPFAPYWKMAPCREFPPLEKVDDFADFWSSEQKPFMGPSVTGYEFSGGSEGQAHAKKINGDHDHCVEKTGKYAVNVAVNLYCPPDPVMFNETRTLARKLWSVYRDIPQGSYSNVESELASAEEEKKFEDGSYSGLERVKAVKAKLDPDNLFTRKLLKV